MSNTFTAQGLADFYQKVADGGEAQLKIDEEWANLFVGGPSLGGSKDKWRIKPTKKVIDLSVLIESGIDCEFSEGISWFFSTLKHHSNGVYMDVTSSVWDKCKPRMNHKHAWQGGECPLPEGFEVKVWYRDDSRCTDTLLNSGVYTNTGWVHRNNGRDIIAFEVRGVVDGYVMTWEQ